MSRHRLALLSTALLMPACMVEGESDPVAFEELVDAEERCIGCNWGPPLTNTHGLNGLSVSALDTDGTLYDGWRLLSIEIVDDRGLVPIYDVEAKDGVLYGHDIDDNTYSADDFVESRWTVYLGDTDETVVMEIVDFTPDPASARYTFMGGGGSNNDKGFTCEQDPDSGEYSVVLYQDLDVDPQTGTHFGRPHTLYFGCLSGAVGKAARWGYSPWMAGSDGHQTASRVVRADFCGDGTPHTVQGIGLQLADAFGINDFVHPEKDTEAMWGPHGADCIKVPRLGQDPSTITCGGSTLPFCSAEETLDDYPSSLLWTKIWQ